MFNQLSFNQVKELLVEHSFDDEIIKKLQSGIEEDVKQGLALFDKKVPQIFPEMGNFLRNLDPKVIGRDAKMKVFTNHLDYGDKYYGQSIQDVLVKELQNNKNFDELLKEHEGQRDERVEDDETLGTHLVQRSKKRGG